jgi:flagellar motor switch protein FliM
VSQLLSKAEVDALLNGVDVVAIGAGEATVGLRKVSAIDLAGRERSIRGRWLGLELVVDRFVRGLRATLGGLLGRVPGVAIEGLELVRFGEVRAHLPQPVSLQLFRMSPLRGLGLVAMSPALVGLVLEVSLGGDAGRRTPLANRELSPIELRVLERLGRRVLDDLGEACDPIAAVEFSLLRSEQNPMLAAIAGEQDLVLRLDVRIAHEDGEPAALTLCLPNAALDPIRHVLATAPGSEREAPATAWSERLRALLDDMDLEIAAELGRARLRMSEVLALRVGDVIALGAGREGPVVVRVEGRPVFLGAPGVAGSSNAVRITSAV